MSNLAALGTIEFAFIDYPHPCMCFDCICFCRGYNIGVRLIEDFLARSPDVGRCHDFKVTAEVLAKVRGYIDNNFGMLMFLNFA